MRVLTQLRLTNPLSASDRIGFHLGQQIVRHNRPSIVSLEVPRNRRLLLSVFRIPRQRLPRPDRRSVLLPLFPSSRQALSPESRFQPNRILCNLTIRSLSSSREYHGRN